MECTRKNFFFMRFAKILINNFYRNVHNVAVILMAQAWVCASVHVSA
jgi:hypothetical protein